MTITPCVLVSMVNIVSTGRVPMLIGFAVVMNFGQLSTVLLHSMVTHHFQSVRPVACSLNSKKSYTDFERTLATATLFCIVAISCPMSQLASTLIKILG